MDGNMNINYVGNRIFILISKQNIQNQRQSNFYDSLYDLHAARPDQLLCEGKTLTGPL